MADPPSSTNDPIRAMHLDTRLTHLSRSDGKKGKSFVNPPMQRGSTVLFPTIKERLEAWTDHRFTQELVYGICGTETHHALENVVADIEGGTKAQLTSSGLSACTIALLSLLKAGDHCLIPDSVYGPVRSFCKYILNRFGVEVTYYPSLADIPTLAKLFRDNTRVLYIESPGSHTFELVDTRALCELAHHQKNDIKVIFDNTWGITFFNPFEHGVDVSMQALTKYLVGHSDALLGAIIVNAEEDWKAVRDTALGIGEVASPDDVWLALRGARTLGIRLQHQMKAGIEIAQWLEKRPEVLRVLHPALPACPGHEIYARDYSGCPSLFGVVFKSEYSIEVLHAMLEGLDLFGIGASWGGYESLVLPTTGGILRSVDPSLDGATARFHIGLEDTRDLIADLERGLAILRNFAAPKASSSSCFEADDSGSGRTNDT